MEEGSDLLWLECKQVTLTVVEKIRNREIRVTHQEDWCLVLVAMLKAARGST